MARYNQVRCKVYDDNPGGKKKGGKKNRKNLPTCPNKARENTFNDGPEFLSLLKTRERSFWLPEALLN
jgi:hypothetical protein